MQELTAAMEQLDLNKDEHIKTLGNESSPEAFFYAPGQEDPVQKGGSLGRP